jgi:cell wall-associated NlpC family hydrolase
MNRTESLNGGVPRRWRSRWSDWRNRRGHRAATSIFARAALLAVTLTIGAVSMTGPTAEASEVDRFARSSAPGIAESARLAIAAHQAWEDTGRVSAYLVYTRHRDNAASQAAGELGLDGDEMRQAWNDSHPRKQMALLSALTQLGVPYRSRASSPGEGFDCSGLTSYAWGAAGLDLPRSSGDQIRAASSRTRDQAEAGDLVQYPGHVMMYLGIDDAIVHSPNSGNHVEIRFITKTRSNSVNFGDPLSA